MGWADLIDTTYSTSIDPRRGRSLHRGPVSHEQFGCTHPTLTYARAIVTIMSSCTEGWTTSPDASWATCYKLLSYGTKSLRECVDLCAAEQAVPPCINSAEEEQFILDMLKYPQAPRVWHWRGTYRLATETHCVSGGLSEYSHPRDTNTVCSDEVPCSCEAMSWNANGFKAVSCDYSRLWWSYPCLCASGSTPSPQYYAAAAMIDANTEPFRLQLSAVAVNVYLISTAVALLPSLIFLCFRGFRFLRRLCARSNDNTNDMMAPASEATVTTRSRLLDARHTASSLRLRISGFLLQAGWFLISMGLAPNMGSIFAPLIEPVVGTRVLWITIFVPSQALILLAIFPTDASVIRVVCACYFGFGLMIFASAALATTNALTNKLNALVIAIFALNSLSGLVSAIVISPALPCLCCCPGDTPARRWAMPPRAALRRLWLAFRVASSIAIPLPIVLGFQNLAYFGPAYFFSLQDDGGVTPWIVAFVSACTVFLTSPARRGRLIRYLGSFGKAGTTKQSEAMAIAALVGGLPPARALDMATQRFRVMPLDRLVETDLATNTDTGLFAKTEACALGDADCFVSHSWSDAGDSKLSTLQSWAAGAPKFIWLDKACINQSDIEANLQALPIFLSGCKQLVVLLGPTYTSRLWCVVELFVFLRMGGERERLRVYELDASAASDKAGAHASVLAFDASRAQCFLPRDRHHLLGVIESGFGDCEPFNHIVRAIFCDALGIEAKAGKEQKSWSLSRRGIGPAAERVRV